MRGPAGDALVCAAAGLAAFVLYVATLAPSIVWEDSANYVCLAWDPGNRICKRMIDQYPLYLWMLRQVPRSPAEGYAWRINLTSAAFGAAAIALVCGAGILASGSRAAGALGAGALAVAQPFWHYAVTAKVYPCVLMFLAGELLLCLAAVRRGRPAYLAGALAAFGASLLTHRFAFLALPFLVWTQIRHRRTLWHPAMAGAWILALAPLAAMAAGGISTAGGTGVRWGLWPDPKAGGSQEMFLTLSPDRLAEDATLWGFFTLLAFPAGWAAAAAGAWRLLRERSPLLAPIVLLYAADVTVAFDFESLPRLNWYLPGHVALAVLAAAGAAPLRALLARGIGSRGAAVALTLLLVALPPALYATIVFTPAGNPLRDRMNARHERADTGYYDRVRYYLWPPKRGYDEVTRYVDQALATIPEGAYMIADLQQRDALAYALVLGLAPREFELVHFSPQGESSMRRMREALREHVGRRPVFVDTAYAPYVTEAGPYRVERRGLLLEVTPAPAGE